MTGLHRRIPVAALVLGWLGVLPFAGLCGAALTGAVLPKPQALDALAVYAMIILAFMGGVRWGLAMISDPQRPSPDGTALMVSVVPALIGCACWFLPRPIGLVGLMVGFAGLLAYDLLTGQSFRAPAWYPRLRIQLTAAVLTCLGVAAAFQ
jgi:hypothetical protein